MSEIPGHNCEAVRRRLLSEPGSGAAELRALGASCPACGDYARDLQRFELRLRRALQIDLPPSPRAQVIHMTRRPDRNRSLLAMAASVVLGLGILGVWVGWPEPALARDLVAHVGGEPQAWTAPPVPVARSKLDAVLDHAGVRLKNDSPMVSYANACEFRGHVVPHLLVRTEQGPVTLMILADESVPAELSFDEQGYRGTIVPVPGHGSIAVLTRGRAIALTPIVQTLLQHIVWLPRSAAGPL